jgi:hypothetical protein
MADRVVFTSEPLCFLFNRYGKFIEKQVKQILYDFYDAAQLTVAKNLLADEIEKLNLDRWARPRRHVDNEMRAKKDVDDLYAMMTFVDENGALPKLPVFVSADIDKLPTTRWMDGDFQLLTHKLEQLCQLNETLNLNLLTALSKIQDLSTEVQSNKAAISKLEHCLCGIRKLSLDLLSSVTESAGGALDPSLVTTDKPGDMDITQVLDPPCSVMDPAQTSIQFALPASSSSMPPQTNVSETTSNRVGSRVGNRVGLPFRELSRRSNVVSTAESAAGDTDGDNYEGPWIDPHRQRRDAKRRRRSSSGLTGPRSIAYPTTTPALTARQHDSTRVKIVGRSSGVDAKIQAATIVSDKHVFCVSNIAVDYATSDIVSHLHENGINVVSCFPAKTKFKESKAFRVCIVRKDIDRFVLPDVWPENVIIRDWIFLGKPNIRND